MKFIITKLIKKYGENTTDTILYWIDMGEENEMPINQFDKLIELLYDANVTKDEMREVLRRLK